MRDWETAEKLKEILRRDMEARKAREAAEGAPPKDAKTRKKEANEAKKLRPIPPPPPLDTLMEPRPSASEITDFYHLGHFTDNRSMLKVKLVFYST